MLGSRNHRASLHEISDLKSEFSWENQLPLCEGTGGTITLESLNLSLPLAGFYADVELER